VTPILIVSAMAALDQASAAETSSKERRNI
jgi:hypothetical protein